MLIIERKADASAAPSSAELVLPFELRQKSRLRAVLSTGEEAALFMPRGTVLRNGDCLQAEDGRVVRVVAQAECVLHITAPDARTLTRIAYHLGNRHMPLQVGDGWLRVEADHVLRDMVLGLGGEAVETEAPFEPEAGAYGGHGGHTHPHSHGKGAKIHDHFHDHAHGHSHDHGH